MLFRSPVVRFFSRILNRITITVVLVALQLLWLCWVAFAITTGTGRVWVNGLLNALSLLIVLYLVRKDENSAYKVGWIALIGILPLLGGALYLAFGNKRPAKRLRLKMQAVEDAHKKDLVQEPGVLEGLDAREQGQSRYVAKYGPYPAWQNTRTQYFACGEAMYPQLLADLEKAEKSIFLEFFIVTMVRSSRISKIPGTCLKMNDQLIKRSGAMSKRISALLLCLFLFCLLIVFPAAGCGQNSSSGSVEEPPVFSPLKVLVPEAPGTDTIGYSPLILDISNISQGYLTAVSDSNGTTKNIQLSADDGVVYSYFVSSGESAVIPFTSGSGTYQISCYEQVNGSQYAALFAQALEVSLENEFLPFLYPNQYVNFTPDSEACKLALSLLAEDATEQESIDTVFQYVTQHVTYDEDKAATVETGYLPDIDETLSTGKGICFDYAALMTAMLRSRDIPCKLQIGYAGDIKHAWIDVYIRGKGWVEQAITYDGEKWNRMDPTFTANSEDEELINSYIGDSANYTLQFTR